MLGGSRKALDGPRHQAVWHRFRRSTRPRVLPPAPRTPCAISWNFLALIIVSCSQGDWRRCRQRQQEPIRSLVVVQTDNVLCVSNVHENLVKYVARAADISMPYC